MSMIRRGFLKSLAGLLVAPLAFLGKSRPAEAVRDEPWFVKAGVSSFSAKTTIQIGDGGIAYCVTEGMVIYQKHLYVPGYGLDIPFRILPSELIRVRPGNIRVRSDLNSDVFGRSIKFRFVDREAKAYGG